VRSQLDLSLAHGTSEEVAIEDVALGTAARLFAELKNVSKLRDRRLYV
jgi:hypothetical protein